MSLKNRLFGGKKSPETGLFADAQAGVEPEYHEQKRGPISAVAAPKKNLLGSLIAPKDDAVAKRSKSSKNTKASAIDARPAELVENNEQTAMLAFGVRWRTIVKAGGGREAAQDMAAKAKATHFFLRSHQLGYTQIPKNVSTAVYPAALIAAKCHAGAGLFLLSLDQNTYWLSLVRNGQPTNTDEIIAGLSEANVVARARALIQNFPSETITVFSDIRNAGFDGQRQFGLVDLFETAKTDADRLLKVQIKKGSIPKPVMIITSVGMLILVGNYFYKQYQEDQARKLAAQSQVAMLTPEEAWKPVYEAWQRDRVGPNYLHFEQIRISLAKLPVLWSGWTLSGARCQIAGQSTDVEGGNKSRTWNCVATYERPRIATTSGELKAAVGVRYPNHAIAFPNLSTMQMSWSETAQHAPVDVSIYGDPAALALQVSSELQTQMPTLSVLPEFAITPLDLPQPKQPDGTPISKPVDMPQLYAGAVSVRGPFRSMDVLASKLAMVEWNAIGLVVDTKAMPTQKSISASSLMVELTGNVYGKK
jgi:hypothetical protein